MGGPSHRPGGAQLTVSKKARRSGLIGVPFDVHEPPELVEHVRHLADRLHAAVPADTHATAR